jgi:hypothetical protein
VSSGSPSLIGPTQRAISTWNALIATTQNCIECALWEGPPSMGDTFHAESAILHELGHCALGLDHPNRPWDADNDGIFENTSFTRSWGVGLPGGISAGDDDIRGSFDDLHRAPDTPTKLAESVSWFRRSDNDPVIVDGTVIDLDTYSRSVAANLPANHTWAANGNRVVARTLGQPFTQAVMYSLIGPGQQYLGLSADEVNMVRMGMAGEDLMAGTADDYTVELVFVTDCASNLSAIRVTFAQMSSRGAVPVATCEGATIDYAFPPLNPMLARHFEVVELLPTFAPVIRLDPDLSWDTDPPVSIVFQDDFESGDFSAWTTVVP